MKLNLLSEMLLLSIFFALESEKKYQNMIKDPSFGDPRGLLTCLLLKVNLFSQMLLLSIFLHEKMKKNQNMIKESSFGTPHGLLTCLLTLSLRTMPVGVVSGLLKF